MMTDTVGSAAASGPLISWKMLAAIFGAYFLANRVALIFPDAENILAVIWPAAGIGLASLLLTPCRAWPAVLVTVFFAGNIANLTAGRPLFNSLGFMTANVLESWGCALVLVRMCGQDIRFCRMRDIVALGVGATLVNALSAIVGAGTAAIAGLAPFYTFWRTWLIADGLGIFLITPLVVVCFRSSDNARTKRRRMLEITAFFALYLVLSFFTFRNLSPDFDLNPGPYALIALLIWPALRLGTRAVMLSVNLLAVTAVLHVVQHFGSFEQGTPSSETHLLLVQLYIWCAAITAFTLHALSKQRDATELSLKDSMEWFQTLISQSQDGIMVLNFDGSPRMANKRACDNLGYTQEEFLKLHLQDWDPDFEERGDVTTLWHSLPVTIEARHKRKDGTIFPVEVSISRIEQTGESLLMGIVRDITERKRTEAALRENVTNFRALVDTMADMIAVVGSDGRFLFTNPAATQELGYSAEELANMRLMEIYPEELHKQVRERVGEVRDGIKVVRKSVLKNKSGTLVPVETRGWLGSWNGESCAFGISKNLTAEQEAQLRFETLFQNNPALMALSALPERVLIDVNIAMTKVLGYTREELLGHTALELGIFVDLEDQAALAERVRATGAVRNWELQVRCKDGSIRDGIFSGELVHSSGKQYLLTVMVDITDRKAAERRLISSEERLAMALRGANAGLWDWNVQTGELIVNARWAEMLGYAHEELQPVSAETWRRLCHPDDLVEAERLLWQQLAGETDYYLCELRMKHKDGRWIWIQDSGKCMEWTPDGKPLRMVGTHVDVSARKQSEELREDVERIIRHDLRAPAGSAVSVARLLAESPDLSGEDRMLAMQLERSGQDMLDTLNLSLEMQKIESGSARYQFEDIPLLLLINEIIDGLRLRPEHRKKHFDVMIDPFGTVRGVPFLMRMALQNIIQNAVEAVSAGETVYVLAAFGTQIAISVRNNGVIPEAIRSRFFEKYVTHGKSNGTGLGTYSAKLLTEAQGGSIFMDSSTLTGKTELTLTFPAATS